MRRINLAILGAFAATCILAGSFEANAAPDLRLRPALRDVGTPQAVVQVAGDRVTQADQIARAKAAEGRMLGPSNGKPGKLSLLNTTMLIKGGALAKPDAIKAQKESIKNRPNSRYYDASRRWSSNGKPGKMSMLNMPMLLKGGALQKPDAIKTQKEWLQGQQKTASGPKRWVSNGKRGNLAMLNLPMLIKGGCMSKPDAIRTQRDPIQRQTSARTRTSHRVRYVPRFVERKPPRDLNQGMVFRRERVGRFCSGRSCER